MLLARLADTDHEAGGLLWCIEERELWEDYFVRTNSFPVHLRGLILDKNQEIKAISNVKDLAKLIWNHKSSGSTLDR